jgi:hypothetical protein
VFTTLGVRVAVDRGMGVAGEEHFFDLGHDGFLNG